MSDTAAVDWAANRCIERNAVERRFAHPWPIVFNIASQSRWIINTHFRLLYIHAKQTDKPIDSGQSADISCLRSFLFCRDTGTNGEEKALYGRRRDEE
jgi:hypothetical protein